MLRRHLGTSRVKDDFQNAGGSRVERYHRRSVDGEACGGQAFRVSSLRQSDEESREESVHTRRLDSKACRGRCSSGRERKIVQRVRKERSVSHRKGDEGGKRRRENSQRYTPSPSHNVSPTPRTQTPACFYSKRKILARPSGTRFPPPTANKARNGSSPFSLLLRDKDSSRSPRNSFHFILHHRLLLLLIQIRIPPLLPQPVGISRTVGTMSEPSTAGMDVALLLLE